MGEDDWKEWKKEIKKQQFRENRNKFIFPIHPTYLSRIFGGRKKIEVRKLRSGAVNQIKKGDLVVFYETRGVGALVGEAGVYKVEKMEREKLEKRLPRLGVSSKELHKYVGEAEQAILIHLLNPRKYRSPEGYSPPPQTVVRYDES